MHKYMYIYSIYISVFECTVHTKMVDFAARLFMYNTVNLFLFEFPMSLGRLLPLSPLCPSTLY